MSEFKGKNKQDNRSESNLVKRFGPGSLSAPPPSPHAQRWHVKRGANRDQAYWQCQFCRCILMRSGRKHVNDETAWYDVNPCPEAEGALRHPEYQKPENIKRQTTETGIDTPPYPWPKESASLEGLTGLPRPVRKGKGTGKGPTKAQLLEKVKELSAELERIKTSPTSAWGEAPQGAKGPTPWPCPKQALRPPHAPRSEQETPSAYATPPSSPPGAASWYRLDAEQGPSPSRRRAAESDPTDGTPESMDGQEMGPEALLEAQAIATRLRVMSRRHPDLDLESVLQPQAKAEEGLFPSQ
jgi:hypothetical protein